MLSRHDHGLARYAAAVVITRSHTGFSPLPYRSALATINADPLAAQYAKRGASY
jgi:hypothetical protein